MCFCLNHTTRPNSQVSTNTVMSSFAEGTLGLSSEHQGRQLLLFQMKQSADRDLVHARSIVNLILGVERTTVAQKLSFLKRAQLVESLQRSDPFAFAMSSLTRFGLDNIVSVKDGATSLVFDRATRRAIKLGESRSMKFHLMEMMKTLNKVSKQYSKEKVEHEKAEGVRIKAIHEKMKKAKQ